LSESRSNIFSYQLSAISGQICSLSFPSPGLGTASSFSFPSSGLGMKLSAQALLGHRYS
jgi:hypothetical protein